jgi:hypothetical protein
LVKTHFRKVMSSCTVAVRLSPDISTSTPAVPPESHSQG